MQAYAAEEINALNPFALGRVRNALVTALNESVQCPRIIIMILEDDIINGLTFDEDVEITEKLLYKVYNKVCKWIVREVARLIECYVDVVPAKAMKRDPMIIWVLPTQHKNYKNNWERHIFSKCLNSAAKGKKNMPVLELKQVWDEYDGNLFSKERNHFTDQGHRVFWQAVDRTVRFIVNTQKQQDENSSMNNAGRGGFYPRRPFGGRRFQSGRGRVAYYRGGASNHF